jgi:hypothetical protein
MEDKFKNSKTPWTPKNIKRLLEQHANEEAYAIILNALSEQPWNFLLLKSLAEIVEATAGTVGALEQLIQKRDLLIDYIAERKPILAYRDAISIIDQKIMRAGFASNARLLQFLEKTLSSARHDLGRTRKIILLSCIWGRKELTEIFLSYYKRLQEELVGTCDLIPLIVGSEGVDTRLMVERFCFRYIEHENQPLSEKWEAGLKAAKNIDSDAVVIVGSDDFLTRDTIKEYLSWIEIGVLSAGFSDGYFLDLANPDDMLYWRGYGGMHRNAGMPRRINETIGMGRFYSRELLEFMNFSLWAGPGIDKGLDSRSRANLLNIGLRPVTLSNALKFSRGGKSWQLGQICVPLKDKNLFVVDVKFPNASVTPINNYLRGYNASHKFATEWSDLGKRFDVKLSEDLRGLSESLIGSPIKIKITQKLSEEKAFDFLKSQIEAMFARNDHGLQSGEKGRLYAWYWGYYGRALLDLYRSSGNETYGYYFRSICDRLFEERDEYLGLEDEERFRPVASWGTRFKNGKRSNEITTAGLITLPIAEYCSLFGGQSLSYEVIRTLREFIGEVKSCDLGCYFYHISDGIIEPLNHSNLYAASLAYASRLPSAPLEFNKISLEVYRYFRKFVMRSSSGLIKWPYAPAPQDYGREFVSEPIWKGGATIELPVALANAGLIKRDDPFLGSIINLLKKNKHFSNGKLPQLLDNDSEKVISGAKFIGTSLAGFLSSWVQLNDPELNSMIIRAVQENPEYFPNGWLGEQFPNKGGSRAMIMAHEHLRLNWPHLFG